MGPVPVNFYGLFMMLAFSGAFAIIHTRARQVGIHPDRLIPGYVSAAVGGMLGARLLYAVSVDWERTISNPISLMSCAGFAFYGGVIGGAIGVAIFVFASRLPPWKIADLAAPGVLLGYGLGRMGCFFSGCCHGAIAPTPEDPIGLLPEWFTGGQLWLSHTWPYLTNEVHGGVGRIHDIPLYPTQLWSAFEGLTLFGITAWAWTRRRFDGQIAALALIIEPPFRIFIESLRADERGYLVSWSVSAEVARWFPGMAQAGEELGQNILGITTSQAIGAAMITLGVVIWAVRFRTVRDATPAVDPEADLLEELTA
jgi:phosphatidylglycerol:prolipoprotein diacylglycerol transferase